MNVAETRIEMLACVAELRQSLTAISNPVRRADLAEQARRRIERLRKRFKHRIDTKACQRFGFSINAREGIEIKLVEATARALAAIGQAEMDCVPPPAVADGEGA